MENEIGAAQRIEQINKRLAKVADGPWIVSNDDAEDAHVHANSGLAMVDTGRSSDWPIARLTEWQNAEFIAHAREDIPWLLARLAPQPAPQVDDAETNATLQDLASCFADDRNPAMSERTREMCRAAYLTIVGLYAEVKLLKEAQPAPGPQVDVREIAKKVAKVTVEAFKKLADWELAAEMELRNHLSAAPEVKGYDIRKNPEPAPGPQVDVEALAHDIAMSVGTLIFNDKDWNVSKIEASVRKHLGAAPEVKE